MKFETKIKILLLFFILVFNNKTYSQFRIAPYIGGTLSKITETQNDRPGLFKYPESLNRKDFSVGISVQRFISEKWLLKSDFQYYQIGSETESDIELIASDIDLFEIEFQYFNASFRSSRYVNKLIFVEFGVYNSLLIHTYFEGINFGGRYRGKANSDIFSKTDFGLIAGGGIEKWDFYLVIDYFYGIKKIREQDKNRFIQLSIGYLFEIN